MGRQIMCALGFLTRLPVPNYAFTEPEVARSAGYFAWVGLLISGLLWLAWQACSGLDASTTALCVVIAWTAVTGGFHLDGLADTFDGLSGGRGDRERTLGIMRDSRIGAHGALALVLTLCLKWVTLASLLSCRSSKWLVAPVIARWMCTLFLAGFSYARTEGAGSAFVGRVGPTQILIGTVALGPIVALFGSDFASSAAVGIGFALILILRLRNVLGGITGDVHGAAIEICEVGILLSLAWRMGRATLFP